MDVSKAAEVRLLAVTVNPDDSRIGPEELSVYGAMACFKEESSYHLLIKDLNEKSPEALEKKKVAVLKNSAGRGHGSVIDQNYFIFSIENLTRAATLQLCLPQYLAHLQQSLRRASADRGFYLPKQIRKSDFFEKVKKTLSEAFNLYEKMSKKGIPNEDARYILPLYTRTNIQTGGDARELIHLLTLNEQGETPSAVVDVVEDIIKKAKQRAPNLFTKWGWNYETLAFYPSPVLYSSQNQTVNEIISKYGEVREPIYVEHEIAEEVVDRAVRQRNESDLSALKHVHNGKFSAFLVPMSIATYHQATRQRTWDQSVESIYDAAKRNKHIIPPSVKSSDFLSEFERIKDEMMQLYKELTEAGIERKEAIGLVPHSLLLYDLVHINGWNAMHAIGKRTCIEAQWEIRAIANKIAAILRKTSPIASKYSYPQGVIYGDCPEMANCGLCEKILKSLEAGKHDGVFEKGRP